MDDIYIYIERERERERAMLAVSIIASLWYVCWFVLTLGRGDDTVGNPHRAQIAPFEFLEPILLLKLDKQVPVEQFEATVSQ